MNERLHFVEIILPDGDHGFKERLNRDSNNDPYVEVIVESKMRVLVVTTDIFNRMHRVMGHPGRELMETLERILKAAANTSQTAMKPKVLADSKNTTVISLIMV